MKNIVNALFDDIRSDLSLYCFFGSKLEAIVEANITFLMNSLSLGECNKVLVVSKWNGNYTSIACYFNDKVLNFNCFLNNNAICIDGFIDKAICLKLETKDMLLRFEDLKYFDDPELSDVEVSILSPDGNGCDYYLKNYKKVSVLYNDKSDHFSGVVEDIKKEENNLDDLDSVLPNKKDNYSQLEFRSFKHYFKVGSIISNLDIKNMNYQLKYDTLDSRCNCKVIWNDDRVLYDGYVDYKSKAFCLEKNAILYRIYPPDKTKLFKFQKHHHLDEVDNVHDAIISGTNDASLVLKNSFIKMT